VVLPKIVEDEDNPPLLSELTTQATLEADSVAVTELSSGPIGAVANVPLEA